MKKLLTFIFAASLCTNVFSQKSITVAKPITPITVDGYFDEYSWNVNKNIKNQINVETTECGNVLPGVKGNNRAKFGLLWDITHLYVGARVYDSQLAAEDKVNIFLSMDNDRTSNCPGNWPKAYDMNTYQFMFDPTTNTVMSPQGAEIAVAKFATRKVNGGYLLEAALLWEELDFFLGSSQTLPGRKIGFDIGVWDADAEGIRTSELMWNQCCANRNWTEATNFGTIKLSSKLAVREADEEEAVTNMTDATENEMSMTVYPNPNKGNFTVNVANGQGELKISNLLGEVVQKQTLDQVNSSVKVAGLTSGIYILEVNNGAKVSTQKIVVE
ncbi:MAG TPA: sugar-binding protein [Cytophagaceae bacterium]|jgi:hypothetical protein